MILVVGGIKGGCGKTTIATNLAVLRSSEGKKVLLVDADEQKSASDWADQRTGLASGMCQFVTISLAGKGIYAQLQKLKEDYEDIIIDVGGRDTTSQRSSLMVADIFLVPFKPSSYDVWTLGSLKRMILEITASNHSLKTFAVINQADSRGEDNESSFQIIEECQEIKCLKNMIGTRKAFRNAASQGLGVSEIKPQDKKASKEIISLYQEIYGLHI
jgi:chromosome partitioning protein